MAEPCLIALLVLVVRCKKKKKKKESLKKVVFGKGPLFHHFPCDVTGHQGGGSQFDALVAALRS